jgi:hypothetical protein
LSVATVAPCSLLRLGILLFSEPGRGQGAVADPSDASRLELEGVCEGSILEIPRGHGGRAFALLTPGIQQGC